MRPPKIHRNVTLERMALDFWQFFRSQRVVTQWRGPRFERSRRFVEIDLTYRCNLQCANCNRSCTQAPSKLDLSTAQVASFIDQSIAGGVRWERIRLLGGEPTLHKDFFAILDQLMTYRRGHRPRMRIMVCTNGSGSRVREVLSRLPTGVEVKNTFKNGSQRRFRPFNSAPADSPLFRFSDFSAGCRILNDCGLGVTPLGYYPCAIAGGIDRIFGFGLGRQTLPSDDDSMRDQLAAFCPLCGHFGFSWPTKKVKISPVWSNAYRCSRFSRLTQVTQSSSPAEPETSQVVDEFRQASA